MIAKVDEELCTACTLCIDICPQVFKLEDEVAFAYQNPVPEEFEASCRNAADQCPVVAITIE